MYLYSYSIAQTVDDLQVLVSQLVPPFQSFHLLGHSYGGVITYEYIAKHAMTCMTSNDDSNTTILPKCQSMILSNAGISMRQNNAEYDRLWAKNPKEFWTKHACRVGTPPPLADAFQNLGKVWGGMGVVLDWEAVPIANQDSVPPTLVISGSFDFSYKGSNAEAWKPFLPNLVAVNLEKCAHYPFYEDGPEYGRIIDDFLDSVEKDST